jgi:hypothetical protein
VRADTDFLMVVAYRLQESKQDPLIFSPRILDVGVFPMADCVAARDDRLTSKGGKWFGDYETPAVLSRQGLRKIQAGETVNYDQYGRKEHEGYDLNEDTNFGKLKRIPYRPLQEFLREHGATYARKGRYPKPWALAGTARDFGAQTMEDVSPADDGDVVMEDVLIAD